MTRLLLSATLHVWSAALQVGPWQANCIFRASPKGRSQEGPDSGPEVRFPVIQAGGAVPAPTHGFQGAPRDLRGIPAAPSGPPRAWARLGALSPSPITAVPSTTSHLSALPRTRAWHREGVAQSHSRPLRVDWAEQISSAIGSFDFRGVIIGERRDFPSSCHYFRCVSEVPAVEIWKTDASWLCV